MRKSSLENELDTEKKTFINFSKTIKALEDEIDLYLMHFEGCHGKFMSFLKDTRDIVDKCMGKMVIVENIINGSVDNKNE